MIVMCFSTQAPTTVTPVAMTTYLMGFGDAIAKEKIIDGKLCIRDLSKYILMLEIAVKVQEDR